MRLRSTNKTAVFTICSANYIPTAMVFLESVNRNAHDVDIYLILCETDAVCRKIRLPDYIKTIHVEKLGIPEFKHMAFYYNITELNTAVKPYVITTLFAEGYDKVLYFDPDICVYSSIQPLINMLDEANVVLTPHVCKPFRQEITPTVADLIRGGQFNLGFIGLKQCVQTRSVVKWWEFCLFDKCLHENDHKYFVDQFWAAHIVSFVDKALIVRSEAYNMAYWNFFHRKLFLNKGQWMTGDGPLVFYHYSGYSVDNPEVLTKHSPRGNPIDTKHPVAKLVLDYKNRILLNRKKFKFGNIKYSYGYYADGIAIEPVERRNYLLSFNSGNKLSNPFAPKPKPPKQPKQKPEKKIVIKPARQPKQKVLKLAKPVISETDLLRRQLVKDRWTALKRTSKGHIRSLAVWPAGQYTSWLHEIVKNSKGPNVVAVLDDKPDSGKIYWGLKPSAPAKANKNDFDSILLATDSIADKLTAKSRELFGDEIELIQLDKGLPRNLKLKA